MWTCSVLLEQHVQNWCDKFPQHVQVQYTSHTVLDLKKEVARPQHILFRQSIMTLNVGLTFVCTFNHCMRITALQIATLCQYTCQEIRKMASSQNTILAAKIVYVLNKQHSKKFQKLLCLRLLHVVTIQICNLKCHMSLCTVKCGMLNTWELVFLISWTVNKRCLKFIHLSCCDWLSAMAFPTKNAATLNEKPIPFVGGQFNYWCPTTFRKKCHMHWNDRLQFMILRHILSFLQLTPLATTAVSVPPVARLAILSSMFSVLDHVTYVNMFSFQYLITWPTWICSVFTPVCSASRAILH
jgi:hypothetical protein